MNNNQLLPFPVSIFLALLPCFLWLLFYLRKDNRPEPKRMVIKVFLLGILVTFPLILIETVLLFIIDVFSLSFFWKIFILSFLVISLIEELGKFFILKTTVFSSPEFDEPVDGMIYGVIVALGFAASENFFYLFPISLKERFTLAQAFLFRSLGATFFHTLSSAILGFFVGLSFFFKRRRSKLITLGLFLAFLLHGVYDFCILYFERSLIALGVPIIILFFVGILVSLGFEYLKKLAKIKQYAKFS